MLVTLKAAKCNLHFPTSPPLMGRDIAIAFTKIDCDHAARQEIANRRHSFKTALHFDKSADFSKLAYKIVRGSNSPPMTEIPAVRQCSAALGRLTKGRLFLVIQDADAPSFRINEIAYCGDAKVTIVKQDSLIVDLVLHEGVLPSHGILRQEYVARSNNELYDEFRKFWSSYWLRDDPQTQFDDSSCSSFFEEIELAQLPQFPTIDIDLTDIALWTKAIHDLKAYKAHGVCGWRHEELKCLPVAAIRKLSVIFPVCRNLPFPVTL